MSEHIILPEQAFDILLLPTNGRHSEAGVVTAERRVWDPGAFAN